MYGLNALAGVFFLTWHFISHWLAKAPPALCRKVLATVLAGLLGANLLLYGLIYPVIYQRPRLPIEFSALAYFVVPLILLNKRSRGKGWAAYAGLMAGLIYYLAMMIGGGALYDKLAPPAVYLSLLFHGALYLSGLVTISRYSLRQYRPLSLLAGVALVGMYAVLLRPLVDQKERLFIYILLDGSLLRVLPVGAAEPFIRPVYYILLAGLIGLSVQAFLKLSAVRYAKFSRFSRTQANEASFPSKG